MKVRWILALLAVLLVAAPASARRVIKIDRALLVEQVDDSANDRPSLGEGSEREQLRSSVREWRRRVQEGNASAAEDLLPEMTELLKLPGVKDRRTLLGAFVALGQDWSLLGEWENAERAYQAALTIDPEHPSALLGLGELAYQRDGGLGGAIAVVAATVRATKASVLSLTGGLRLAANLSLIFLVGALVASCALALVMLAKYNRLLRHGVSEIMGERGPEGLDRVVGWVVVALPLLLFLPPIAWGLYWLVVLRPYGTKGERRLCLIGLLILALVAPGLFLVSRLAALPRDPVVMGVVGLQENDVPPRAVEGVFDLVSKQGGRDGARFLLGRLQSSLGRFDDALATYNEIPESSSLFARAVLNRANIHFRRNERGTAIADYGRATQVDPKFALAWRNGGIAYSQDLKTEVAQDWSGRAQALDQKSYRKWNELVGQAEVIDARLGASAVVSLLIASQDDLVSGLVDAVMTPTCLAGIAAVIFSLVLAPLVLGRLAAAACEKCGRAFCNRCHAAAKNSAYCTQCIHLYVKKDGVSPVVRSAKVREVEKWIAINSVATRLFNILLPGAGSLYGNRAFAGMFLLFVWASALAALLLPTLTIMSPDRLAHLDLTVWFGIELALLVLVYLVALVQSLRHSV